MALIKCSECGTTISSTARVCPFCGHPVPVQKVASKGTKTTVTTIRIVALVAAIVFAILFVVSVFGVRKDYKMIKAQLDKNSMGTTWTEQWHEENYGNLPVPDANADYGAQLQSSVLWCAVKLMISLALFIVVLELDTGKFLKRQRD